MVFLNMLDGRWRPPLLLRRYSCWVTTFRVSPDHSLRNFVAMALGFLMTQVIERFVMVMSQTRRVQIPWLEVQLLLSGQ